MVTFAQLIAETRSYRVALGSLPPPSEGVTVLIAGAVLGNGVVLILGGTGVEKN